MYWGEITSRNSLPAGTPSRLISMSSWRANAQALVDAVALIQVGVVDEALPAHGGAGFSKDAHHDFQRVLVLLARHLQAAGIVQRRGRVVDGAGPDDNQQTVVLACNDVVDGLAGLG